MTKYHVIIFFNIHSGNCQGRDIAQLDQQHVSVNNNDTVIELVNVQDNLQCEQALNEINERLRQEDVVVHIVSAGGDGTFNHVIKMCIDNQVHIFTNQDSHKIPIFSCIPLGTGNDLSQALGWTRKVENNSTKSWEGLLKLVKERTIATVVAMDIWNIQFETNSQRGYIENRRGVRENILDDYMSNYMSIGLQGEVGTHFEKHRAHTRFWNVVEYMRQSLRIVKRWDILRVKDYFGIWESDNSSWVMPSKIATSVDLIIQNINGIWGRNVQLWEQCKWEPHVLPNNIANNQVTYQKSSINDKKCEVFTIASRWDYFMKQFTWSRNLGTLYRLGQFGEFKLSILRSCRNLYFMIDGECYLAHLPKSLQVRHQGQIRIAIKNDHQL